MAHSLHIEAGVEVDDLVMWFFHDPRLFNFIIMGMYVGAALWWAWFRQWGDAWYWISALSITAAVTFGFDRT